MEFERLVYKGSARLIDVGLNESVYSQCISYSRWWLEKQTGAPAQIAKQCPAVDESGSKRYFSEKGPPKKSISV